MIGPISCYQGELASNGTSPAGSVVIKVPVIQINRNKQNKKFFFALCFTPTQKKSLVLLEFDWVRKTTLLQILWLHKTPCR